MLELFVLVPTFAQQTGGEIAKLPPMKVPTMPMFSTAILVGGMVAAGLVTSQYKPDKHDTPRERLADLAGIYLKTLAPGVIVSQALYGVLKHYQPTIAKIEGVDLLIGVVVGGVGMKLLLRLYDKLPELAESGIVGYITKKTGVSQASTVELSSSTGESTPKENP